MIVIFDTNIWLGNLYLRSPAASAARFFISKQKAIVALPEVIRLEVEHHLRSDLQSHVSKIEDSRKRLLAAFGTLKEVVLPTREQIEEKISEVLGSLGMSLLDIPFSLESAQDSLLRTIKKIPPSDQGQQFKDGVLWGRLHGNA